MAPENGSLVNEFVLMGLTDKGLFFLFLVMYMVTVLGNLVYTQNVNELHISYRGCMAQLYFFSFFIIFECYTVTSMAYVRYAAICNPLLYNTAMSPRVCLSLMLGSYLMAFSGAMTHKGCMLRLNFCDVSAINHFFCDIFPLLELSCTSTYINELEVFIVVGINIIVRVSKAFSTCSSHIVAVSLFFGSGAFMYLKPSSAGSMDEVKISSVFYTIMVLMMNPLIYSLRNKDVKVALTKTLRKGNF
uniref:G-protein coupled receptors family 1 profile domain-containing protein n=1 Tax=Cavia porcellus TaxID=10141 RepID=A0A286XXX0_CAVPO